MTFRYGVERHVSTFQANSSPLDIATSGETSWSATGERQAHALRTCSPALSQRSEPRCSTNAFGLLLRGRPGRSETELLDLIDQELREKSEEIDELRTRVEQRDDRILDLLGDIDQMNTELETERSRYRQLRWQIEHPAGDGDTVELSLPEAAATLTEAAELCRRHLSQVVLHEDACHDLSELDSAPEGTAWASTSWRGLRALQAYALEAAEFNGGFWQWCERSDHPDTWPATPKKLSMTESETVVKNARLRAARMLPVATTVDPTGSIEMLAHLKIAEGGGSNIPRIYFHDDTANGGKVHVGFFGPHRYMENSKT